MAQTMILSYQKGCS